MVTSGERVTLSDVAAHAGVSAMTASYAYNKPGRVAEATRTKVMAAADELGYRGPDPSARQLRRGALRSLGLVLGESLDYIFKDPEATRFVAGIAEECTRAGYGLTLVPTTGAAEDTERIASAAVDAFILWTTTPDDAVLGAVRATHRPAVIHGGPATEGLTLVGVNNRAAAEALALDVWAGSSHPAVLSFPLDRSREADIHYGIDPATVPFPVTRDRLAGFHDAATKLGLRWEDIPVIVCARNAAELGEAAAGHLLDQHGEVDGIVAMSDQLAVGAIDGFAVRGLEIPAYSTVGGFDDSEVAHKRDLTSVHQSLFEQGARAARLTLGVEADGEKVDAWHVVSRGSSRRD